MSSDLYIRPVKDITKESKEDKMVHNKYNPILPQIPFLLTIFAPVRSGKSVLVMNLIYVMYKKCFDQIVFFSPTVSHDKTTRILWEDPDVVKIDKDLQHIDSMIKAIVERQEEKHEDERKHILIVLDDCLGLMKREGYLTNLCSRYRHYKLSIIITSQNFRSLPPIVRNNSTAVILFKTSNDKELKKIEEEYAGNFPGFISLYKKCTRERFNLCYLNLERIELYHNFESLLYSKDNDNGDDDIDTKLIKLMTEAVKILTQSVKETLFELLSRLINSK